MNSANQMNFGVAMLVLFVGATAHPSGAQLIPTPSDGRHHGDAPYLLEPGWTALLNGRNLKGWHGRDCRIEPIDRGDRSPCCVKNYKFEWFTTKAVLWDGAGNPERLSAVPGAGDRIVDGANGQSQDLLSDGEYGDVELYLEFMLAQKSNSGVYLQGLYEVQLFDSYGAAKLTPASSAGIYSVYRKGGVGKFEGSPPRENASRPAGQWQSLQIWFQAPRFDANGKKTANAEFIRVLHNGALIQENVEVDGPTMSGRGTPEGPKGPLMLQGDHGPVAFRNIYVRPLRQLPFTP
jgi:hypothetical protein